MYHLIFVVIDKMKEASFMHGLHLLEAIFSVVDNSGFPVVAYGTPSLVRPFISASLAHKPIPLDRTAEIPIGIRQAHSLHFPLASLSLNRSLPNTPAPMTLHLYRSPARTCRDTYTATYARVAARTASMVRTISYPPTVLKARIALTSR